VRLHLRQKNLRLSTPKSIAAKTKERNTKADNLPPLLQKNPTLDNNRSHNNVNCMHCNSRVDPQHPPRLQRIKLWKHTRHRGRSLRRRPKDNQRFERDRLGNHGPRRTKKCVTNHQEHPQSLVNYMTITWNYDETTLLPDEEISVNFTLTLYSSTNTINYLIADNVTAFNFDITIYTTEP
jgi:hypothetical protein